MEFTRELVLDLIDYLVRNYIVREFIDVFESDKLHYCPRLDDYIKVDDDQSLMYNFRGEWVFLVHGSYTGRKYRLLYEPWKFMKFMKLDKFKLTDSNEFKNCKVLIVNGIHILIDWDEFLNWRKEYNSEDYLVLNNPAQLSGRDVEVNLSHGNPNWYSLIPGASDIAHEDTNLIMYIKGTDDIRYHTYSNGDKLVVSHDGFRGLLIKNDENRTTYLCESHYLWDDYDFFRREGEFDENTVPKHSAKGYSVGNTRFITHLSNKHFKNIKNK